MGGKFATVHLFTTASLVSVLGAWHMEHDGNKCRRKGDREERGRKEEEEKGNSK